MTHLLATTCVPPAVRERFTVTHVPVALASEIVTMPLLAGVISHRWEPMPSQCSISILPPRSAMQPPDDIPDLLVPSLCLSQRHCRLRSCSCPSRELAAEPRCSGQLAVTFTNLDRKAERAARGVDLSAVLHNLKLLVSGRYLLQCAGSRTPRARAVGSAAIG